MTTATVVPPTLPLVIPQRANLRVKLTLPFSGAGKTVVAEVWKDVRRREKLLDLAVEVLAVTPSLRVALSANWEQTREITKSGVWDLLVVNGDGSRDHWLKGPAVLDNRVTEEAS